MRVDETRNVNHIGGDMVNGDKIIGDKVMGDKYVIQDYHVPAPETKPDNTFPLRYLLHSRNPLFTGRVKWLETLDQNASAGTATVITQAITGIGGIGKTQLAVEYCYRHRDAYDLIYQLRADQTTTLGGDMAELAYKLDLAQREAADQETARVALLRWLETTPRRWLLLYDNADNIAPKQLRPYLPKEGNGVVFITSRNPNLSRLAQTLTLDLFTEEEALAFLFPKSPAVAQGKGQLAQAAALANTLGYFPLALEHARAYMAVSGCSFADYHDYFQTERADLWAVADAPDDYHATIAATWEISFQAAHTQEATAVPLLNLCCFLAPDNIPLAALWQHGEMLPEALGAVAASKRNLDKTIAALRRYSLIKRKDDLLDVHRLVQAVALDRMGEEKRATWGEAAVNLLAAAYHYDEYDMETWEECGRLLPHIQAACELAQTIQLDSEREGYLNNRAGLYLRTMGDYEGALPYFQRALEINKRILGPDHPNTATSLNNMGTLLRAMGGYERALPYFQRALEIRERVLGSDHPNTATSLNNMGTLLRAMGDYEGALPYFQRALEIRERVLGSDHPDTATSLNNMGLLLRAMGDYEGALPYYQRALEIRERVLGSDHPNTATSLNNMGYLLEGMGDYEGALPYYQRALEIKERVLGPDHPSTAASLTYLGSLMESMGDYGGARPYSQRALEINKRILGPDHPTTAISLNNMGYLLRVMGDYEGARAYFQRALEIKERVLGPDHPGTATSLNNMGYPLQSMGDYEGALSYFQRALEIRERVLGSDHPDTAISLNNMGCLLQSMGDYEGALPYFQRALEINKRVLGPDHPNTATSLNNMGGLLDSMGDNEGALPYYQRALEIREQVLGPDHPATLPTRPGNL